LGTPATHGALFGSTVTIEPLYGSRQPDDGSLNRFQIGVDSHGIIAAAHVTAQELNSAHQYRQWSAQLVHQHRQLLLVLGPRLKFWSRLVHC